MIGYRRCSSADQNPDRQLNGIPVDRLFTDAVSGKSLVRPAMTELLSFVRDGDTVLVHSLDRWARNLDDLRRSVASLVGRGVTIRFLTENLTFSGDDNPMSIFLMSVMGAFAEMERSIIRSRQQEGIELAKRRGIYTGRKPALDANQITALRAAHAAGAPKTELAKDFAVSRESVYKYLRLG